MTADKYVLALLLATLVNVFAIKTARAQTIDCRLLAYGLVELNRGIRDVKATDVMSLSFTEFNRAKGTAVMVGNLGQVDVVYLESDRRLTFLQVTDTNNVMVTTIARRGELWWGVHQRQVIIGEVGAFSTPVRKRERPRPGVVWNGGVPRFDLD